MNEYLFKLKKDDKTVGYLKIGNKIWWKINRCWVEIDPQEGCSEFFEDDNGWDTIHPFVTKDKNGDDVFADDKVLSKDKLRKYEVAWNERQCHWFLRGISTSWAVNEPTWKDYELIKDEEK